MNIFASIRTYGQWTVVADKTRTFNATELASVDHAVVVTSQYGNSIEFHMKAGGKKYIPLSNDSTIGVGEVPDLTKAKILTLTKEGENDITRILL